MRLTTSQAYEHTEKVIELRNELIGIAKFYWNMNKKTAEKSFKAYLLEQGMTEDMASDFADITIEHISIREK